MSLIKKGIVIVAGEEVEEFKELAPEEGVEEDDTCNMCQGTGEGQYDRTLCTQCGGRGWIKEGRNG